MLVFWEVERIFMLQHQQTLFLSFRTIKEKYLFSNTKNLTIYRNPKTKRFLDEVQVIGPQWSCTTCNVVNIDGLDIRFSTPVYFFLFCFFFPTKSFSLESYIFNESHPVASAIFFFLFKWFVMVLLSFFFSFIQVAKFTSDFNQPSCGWTPW